MALYYLINPLVKYEIKNKGNWEFGNLGIWEFGNW